MINRYLLIQIVCKSSIHLVVKLLLGICVRCSLRSHRATFSSPTQSWVHSCVPHVPFILGTLLFRKSAKSYFLTRETSQNLVGTRLHF